MSLEGLLAGPRLPAQARPVSRYPANDVDLAFVVGDDVAAASVHHTVARAAGGLLERLQLFDVYRSPQLGSAGGAWPTTSGYGPWTGP